MQSIGPRFGLSYEIASVKNQNGQEITNPSQREMSVEALANDIDHFNYDRQQQFRAVDPDLDHALKTYEGYHAIRLMNPLRLITGRKGHDLVWAEQGKYGYCLGGDGKVLNEAQRLEATRKEAELEGELATEKPAKRLFITVKEGRRGPFVTDVRIEDIPQEAATTQS